MPIIKAVLGPTNTGKTHYAVDRMLAYTSGMIGFPLRLLAREVYDKVVAIKGKRNVALLTGEEYIMPETARYFLCTAEAMPRLGMAPKNLEGSAGGKPVDFVAIDEVQMAADPDRGHIFTDHLLSSRGMHETLFLGSDTIAPLIRKLVPEAEIEGRPRFSNLSYVKPVKLQRLPRRSAVVGFSASDVYGLAELLRRAKGGAAIVMGALSPRTRNAQVELFQSGEVDYLVATDAIGMGLNMDVNHIAFADLAKFDGRNYRNLTPAEAAQIAGRAGRYKRDGTFSTLSGSEPMDPMMVAGIEEHTFESVKRIVWRNSKLDMSSLNSLMSSLEKPTRTEGLHRQRDATDVQVLKALADMDDMKALASSKQAVERLWAVAQVPDFKKISLSDHVNMLSKLYRDLMGPKGVVDHDFIAKQVKHLDNTAGDIDTLASRLASIRLWTYVSHRKGWLSDAAHWAFVTRGVEDKLSDALHERLTQRFVDRRTAVLMRSLKKRDALSVTIDTETNQVSVEGHDIGELQGFSFKVEAGAAQDEQKILKAAADSGLKAEMTRRAKLFANVGVKTLEIDFSAGIANPQLMFEGAPFATIIDTGAMFAPRVKLRDDTLLDGEAADLVLTTAQNWLDARVAEKLEPLLRLAQELNGEIEVPEGDVALSGLARGVAFRLLENFGAMSRGEVDGDLRQLDQDARKGLRRFGIRIGSGSLYIPLVLKPHATELRLMMWAQKEKIEGLPTIPTPGMVWADIPEGAPHRFYELAGFRICGKKAVRADMVERLADAVRPLGQGGDFFEVTPEIMGLVGLSGEAFADVMKEIGYAGEVRNVPAPAKEEAPAAEGEAAEAPAEEKPAEDTAPEAETSSEAEVAPAATSDAEETPEGEAELVERYFFKWAPKRKRAPAGGGNKRGGAPREGFKGKKGKGGHKGGGKNQKRQMSAGPKREKKADPDSPFAALAGLKDQLNKK